MMVGGLRMSFDRLRMVVGGFRMMVGGLRMKSIKMRLPCSLAQDSWTHQDQALPCVIRRGCRRKVFPGSRRVIVALTV